MHKKHLCKLLIHSFLKNNISTVTVQCIILLNISPGLSTKEIGACFGWTNLVQRFPCYVLWLLKGTNSIIVQSLYKNMSWCAVQYHHGHNGHRGSSNMPYLLTVGLKCKKAEFSHFSNTLFKIYCYYICLLSVDWHHINIFLDMI